jgi:histidinol dehydrogenase
MLLHQQTFDYLIDAATGLKQFDIWLKLDAGTENWFKQIDCSEVAFINLVEKMKLFAALAPFTIQTMMCSIEEQIPSSKENSAWIELVSEIALIAEKKYGIKNIQIYGKARPAPTDPKAEKISNEILQERAKSLQENFRKNNLDIPVKVYL